MANCFCIPLLRNSRKYAKMRHTHTHKHTNTTTLFHVWVNETNFANFTFSVLMVHLTASQVKFFSQKHVANFPGNVTMCGFFFTQECTVKHLVKFIYYTTNSFEKLSQYISNKQYLVHITAVKGKICDH